MVPYGGATLTLMNSALGSALGAAEDDAMGAEAEDGLLCGGVAGTRTADEEPETVAGGAGGEASGGAVDEDAEIAEDEALGG